MVARDRTPSGKDAHVGGCGDRHLNADNLRPGQAMRQVGDPPLRSRRGAGELLLLDRRSAGAELDVAAQYGAGGVGGQHGEAGAG
ncbi:hypothetical protein D9M68_896430 [compost metagenome]